MTEARPLVSCVMPTADRRAFVPNAVAQFLAQDYPNRELVVVDDGADAIDDLLPDDPRIRYHRPPRRLVLGAKRNLSCQLADGEVIVHWDDDDWMAPWRVSTQVAALADGEFDVCGLGSLLFHDLAHDRAYRYTYPAGSARPWVAGATMAFRRRFWERNPFPELRTGEDTRFLWSHHPKRVLTLEDGSWYVASIHDANTSAKRPSGSRWSEVPAAEVHAVMAAVPAGATTSPVLPVLLVVVPVLHRPHHVDRLMRSVARSTSVAHRLLFVASPGDAAEISALETAGASFLVLDDAPGPGDYARKVNAAYRSSPEPFIFTGADDLEFHPGWAERALARMTDGVGVVGTNDLGNPRVLRGEHATHSLVRRSYADELGLIDGPRAIFFEGYPHEFCDDELVETAKHRSAFAFAEDSVVEHLHPSWGKGDVDALYRAAPARLREGRRIFLGRRHLWAGRAQPVGPEAPPPAPPAMSVSVIVGTFGDESWAQLAEARALPSARSQDPGPGEVIHVHASTLASARNEAVERAGGEWLLFLDADDELLPGFVDALARHQGDADLINPAVQYVTGGREERPRLLPVKPLRSGNYLIVGTAIRRSLFLAAGGFWEEPQWEDWSLFLRCQALGARIVRTDQAVYRAHLRPDARNATVANPRELARTILASVDAWCLEHGLVGAR